ncbi:hypothetical protein FIBSPDRAFT_1045953 [Athelia psychrophila]|uniref:DUF6533 domain-containing protein n=1 Tax=Athelia psychrophila TaxID=1759441 RepID=A0A166HGJ2_9AGAM|nr:hypothetical protein FIBSPDRAFT_1045953 [Fibularhizoctonia sp. CBS 109695]
MGSVTDQIFTYVSAATLTAFVLDWCLCVDEEVEMCQRTGISRPIVTYYLSRISTMLYVVFYGMEYIDILLLSEDKEPPGQNIKDGLAALILFWISTASSSLLFVLRVLAVFNHSRTAKVLFTLLWVVNTVAPVPLLFNGDNAASCNVYPITMKSCSSLNLYIIILFLSIVFHNSIVFVCVSRELTNNTVTGRRNLRTMLTGDGLHTVSKSLLRSGQLYFGATVGRIVLTVIVYWAKLPWLIYYNLVGTIYLAVSGMLSCRVFRMVLLCQRELGARSGEIRTEEVEEMVIIAMARMDATSA